MQVAFPTTCATKDLAKENGLLHDHAHLLHHATTLARKQPFPVQLHPALHGSPSTRSVLHGGQKTGINPVADVGRNFACNAPSLLHDIEACGGTAGPCRTHSAPQNNGAAKGFATPLPAGSWQLPAPCIPCRCNKTRSRHRPTF